MRAERRWDERRGPADRVYIEEELVIPTENYGAGRDARRLQTTGFIWFELLITASYVVATTTGNQTVRVNQRVNGGRWVPLGVFTLAAGDGDKGGVSRWTSGTGYVVADAVRITRV
ncbi:golvesin C-terminal-like domain-containing protein [Micromonospora sagamiensis]|uniref:golvesin C-terminal-like domain-containing protein n=1 Tax=Micromonospora sagamiensis TaxID=47875 RepID=UPI002FCCECDC